MRGLIRLAGALAVALFLSACLVSSGYSVRSDVVINDGGRTLAQGLTVTCAAFAWPYPGAGRVAAIGSRHWFLRPDGSLLILGDLRPCRRAPQEPAGGGRPFRDSPSSFRSLGGRDTWLFDSAARPTRAEVYDTGQLAREGPFRIVSASTAPSWLAPSSGLDQAFPGRSSLARIDRAALGAPRPPTTFDPGQGGGMTGLIASVSTIEGAPPCGPSAAALAPLDLRSACARMPPCSSAVGAPCLIPEGYVRLVPSADFTSVTVARAQPEPAFIATLYTPATLEAKRIPSAWRWRPRVCFKVDCVDPDQDLGSLRGAYRPSRAFYLPGENKIIRIAPVFMRVDASAFRLQGVDALVP